MSCLRAILNGDRIQVNSGEFTCACGSRRETQISAEITKIHANSCAFVLHGNMNSKHEVNKFALFATRSSDTL